MQQRVISYYFTDSKNVENLLDYLLHLSTNKQIHPALKQPHQTGPEGLNDGLKPKEQSAFGQKNIYDVHGKDCEWNTLIMNIL